MGLGSSLKDLYFHLEDRYYEILDKINSKIPIHKITDPIDKVMPSFALLLLVIVILIAFFAVNFLPIFMVKKGIIRLSVVDTDGYPLEWADVEIEYGGEKYEFSTDEFGGIGDFNVIIGTRLDRLSVELSGYRLISPASTEILGYDIQEEKTEFKFVFEEIITTKEVTLNIVDSETQQLLRGKNATLSFECSNKEVEAPRPMSTMTGTITVVVSMDCGILYADVMVLGYEKKVGIPVSDGGTIFLQEEKIEEPDEPEEPIYGKITVDLLFKGQRVTDQEITVSLYRMVDGAVEGIQAYSSVSSTGQVVFDEVSPGRYKAKSNATEDLSGEESKTIYLNAGDSKAVTLYLKERIVGQIKLRLLDEASGEPVKDARVTLKEAQKEIESGFSDENGEKEFNLKRDLAFNIIIDKEGYCLKRLVEIKKGDDVKEIKLRKYTGLASECGGALIARVKDETNNPVQGAVAMLFDEEGYFLGAQRTTDANGEAEFTGIDNGKYKVFAYKGYGNGWSDVLQYNVREGIEKVFNVTITMRRGTINIRVLDEEHSPLQYSLVTMKSATNDEKIEGPVIIEREDGTYSFEVIAGQPVFFFIQKEGFSSLVSQPVSVQPDAVKDLNFVLETERISGEIESEFLGLFKRKKVVSVVGAGEEYIARFKLSMPVNASYDAVGMHVRTGYENKMELDQIYIKEESVPGNPSTVRGTSYNPGEGINYDSQFYSADGSKWMNFEWSNYTEGIIFIELTVRVRDTALAGAELPIFWRSWAKKGSQIIRDPIDVSLGNTETERDLYAEAYKQTFSVGTETLCTEKWCYSIKILDIEQDLVETVDEFYSAKVGKAYKMEFSVLNNSKSETDEFRDVKLRVFNPEESIDFSEYAFSGELFVEGVAGGSETPEVEIGDLPINREVKGTIYFSPKAHLSSTIIIRLHDPHRHEHIFEKSISLELVPAEEFRLLFESEGEFTEEPPLLPSGIENEIRVKVLRLRDSIEIENAVVKVKNAFGNTLSQTTTTSLGIATLTLPILGPGEKLIIAVEKPDYETLEKEIMVDSKLLEIEPEQLGFSLNAVEQLPDTQMVSLKNLTELELTLESVELHGEFYGLIDEEKAHEWLFSEYFGKRIDPKGSLEIAVKIELSDLGELVEENKTLNGKLNFTVSALGESWVFSADTTINIGLGGETDDPNCLSLSKHSWQATIQSQEATTDFEIVNACTVNGKPIELKNLSAKIEWKSNHLGDFWLKLGDISIQLYGTYPKILRGVIEEQGFVAGMLSFTPDSGIVGTAEATITVSAEHSTAGGKQVLSDSMDVSIKIVNMAGCLKFSKDLIRMMEGEEESFTIEATENCSGKVGIRLDTELSVSQKEFSISPGETTEITVLAEENYPGQYPIYIYAKGPGVAEYSFTKLIRVLIDTDGCIRLNKYEYDIYDCEDEPYDGYDVGKLINVCHSKVVNAEVHFDEKDLWLAFINSWPWALAGFLYGGFNAMSEGKTFWGTDKPSTICANAGYELCGRGMICKGEQIKQVRGVICCATECVTTEEGADIRKDICGRGPFYYNYCGAGNCVGKEIPIKGIYCCKGKCKEEFEFAALQKICKKQGYNYCKAGEQCSEEFEWVEGAKCCTGKCRKPRETAQMMVCSDYGKFFCNESDGWFCKPGSEFIVEEKGVKCCNTKCIREEEILYECKPKEICEGIETIQGEITYCDVPCTPEVAEISTEDEKCKDEALGGSWSFDYCETGTECIGATAMVDGIECCKTMCVEPGNTDFYKQFCSSQGVVDFCDEKTESCPEGMVSPTDGAGMIGVRCCNTGCESLFEPKVLVEECVEGEIVEGAEPACREGYNNVYIKKVHADCTEYWDVYDTCATDEQCQEGQCKAIETLEPCIEGDIAPGAQPKCFDAPDLQELGMEVIPDPLKYTWIKKVHADCSEYWDIYEECPETMRCKDGQCETTYLKGPGEAGMPAGMAAGGIFDIAGSLTGSIGDAINAFLGIDNPWEGAIIGSLIGTLYNYMIEQEEGTLPYTTTATDLKITALKLLVPAGLEEIEETLISVSMGEESIQSSPDYPLGEQEIEIVFENQGITQEEPFEPIYRVLKAEGEKPEYDLRYEVKKKEDAEKIKEGEFLEVKSKEGFSQKFHLQFNAYCPVDIKPHPMEEVSCMIDGMTGTTGLNALPKVVFRWDWSSIKENTCDEDGEGTYCDATQFSIELLKKINKIDELLRHQVLACPTTEGVLSDKTQELSEDELDVGITRIRIEKAGSNARVIGTIESNNNREMTVKAIISLEKEETGEAIECPEAEEKAVQVITKSDVSCTFNDLDDGLYRAKISINPLLSTCETECKNDDLGNDSIETMLLVGVSGLFERCEPYSTSRLAEFAAANPENQNLKRALELTNFKANLIMDGYTNDFRSDFHDFATTKDFFNTPSYYKGDTGLWKYFTDTELFEFKSPFLRPESGYLRSGKYQVRIIIDYEDDSWSLFRETEPNARISVKLDHLVHPEPDSPFYYMPFDGLVGVETENGRQGYGVNYRQESLEEIKINEDVEQLIRTSTIAPSTPIPGGWVYSMKVENFRTLNNDRRGVLLDIERSPTESSIILSPSDATPVILKVAGGAMRKAWAFYSLSIDGKPQILGPYLTSWTGFVRGCRDFSDGEIVETFTNRRDLHGGITREGACAPLQRQSDYGLEWCDVKRKGNVFLKTVFFTPQGTESILELTDSQDEAVFIAPGTVGSDMVYLTGVYNDRIDSVEKVFELVKTEDVCVAGLGNSAKMTFFWNPKAVIEKSLKQVIESAENECIPPK